MPGYFCSARGTAPNFNNFFLRLVSQRCFVYKKDFRINICKRLCEIVAKRFFLLRWLACLWADINVYPLELLSKHKSFWSVIFVAQSVCVISLLFTHSGAKMVNHREESPPINGTAQRESNNHPDVAHAGDDDSVEEHLKHAAIIEAPDGGYGWIVLICAFFCNVIVDGIIFTAPETLCKFFWALGF